MTPNPSNIPTKALQKLDYLLSKTWGWIGISALSFIAYFQPALYIYYAILGLIAIDAILGVCVSNKKGSFALSYLGRESSWKVFFYTLVFMAIHIFETTFGSEFNIGLFITFAVAGAFELLSICANGIILKPNFPLFLFLIRYIKGEVAQKLGIKEEEVDFVLSGSLKEMRSDRERNKIREDETDE